MDSDDDVENMSTDEEMEYYRDKRMRRRRNKIRSVGRAGTALFIQELGL
jgi:hypothetical protein